MLLRESGRADNHSVDVHGVVDDSDAGVPHSPELAAFAAAAHRMDDTLPAARDALRAAVGEPGLVEAAATVAIFKALNIAADAAGIPLDETWAPLADEYITTLGFDAYRTAANTARP